jgi:predicted alpha/beta hydrolase family esterase
VPNEQAEKLGRNLNIEPTIIENGGHLNTKAGFTKFEELLKVIT